MEGLISSIDTSVSNKDIAALQTVFGGGPGSWMGVGQGEQRSIASHFISKAVASQDFLNSITLAALEDVFLNALGHLPATVEHAADNTLRQKIFDHKITCDDPDYGGAARVLSGTRIEDSGVYEMTAAKKTNIFVSIAECFLSEDEIAESDAAVAKAGVAVGQIKDKEEHTALILRYKSTYARVLDANRKFLSAASRYHELSQSTHANMIDEDDLVQMLGRAATCAILAPSGPQRQRVLGFIANDERLSALDGLDDFSTHSMILNKMYTKQILRPNELEKFEAALAPHQKAIMGDGLSIMERGVVEHNMIAVSSLYESIYITELANILGVTDSKAENIAASMIMDGSLHCSIDQVEGLLEFETDDTPEELYDRSITNWCMDLNDVTGRIKAATTAK